MFQRILVPLDGSSRAERALSVAARIARSTGGTLIVVHVVQTDSSFYAVPEAMPAQEMIDSERDEAYRYLYHIATSSELSGIQVENIVETGFPVPQLFATIHLQNADLVIMCSHGRTGITRWALGSVAEKIARYGSVPTLILREGGPIPAGVHPDATQPLRILVPFDGSPHAKAALEPAGNLIAALTAPGQGALHLLRVLNPQQCKQTALPHQCIEDAVKKDKHYLQRTIENIRDGFEAASVKSLNVQFTCSVAIDEDVAHAIVRVAENGEDAEGAGVFGGCDLIAIATHGRSGLQLWAMGSVAERVLQATKLPIFLIRPEHKPTERIDPLTYKTSMEQFKKP